MQRELVVEDLSDSLDIRPGVSRNMHLNLSQLETYEIFLSLLTSVIMLYFVISRKRHLFFLFLFSHGTKQLLNSILFFIQQETVYNCESLMVGDLR